LFGRQQFSPATVAQTVVSASPNLCNYCATRLIFNIKDKQPVGAPGHKAPGLKQLGKNPRTQQHGPAANLKGASLFIEEAPNQKL